ncbi:MAG: hypothetical protein LBH98_03250 [Chitinispirillales bacterium]|jgi:hypothetical protein|nr:hypothetical protein [Chitinispirillales bacterium]
MKFSKFFQMTAVFELTFLLISCSLEDFNRHYRQLDDDMIRPFSYQFENPEIAPGDTVELSVIFSGKKINSDDIDISNWKVCWNIYTDRFGNLAPRGEEPLKSYIIDKPRIVEDDENFQKVTLKFVVYDSMLYKSDVIPESLDEMAAMYNFKNIPQVGFPTNKDGFLNTLENLSKDLNVQRAIPDTLGTVIDGLAQVFSAMFEIYVDFNDGKTPRSKIRHTVRYHGKLSDIKGVYTNKNPVIEDIKIWAMDEKDAYNFDINKSKEITKSGDTINISIDKNKTIFMEIKALPKDSTLTLEQAFSKTRNTSFEKYYVRFFFAGDTTYSKLSFSPVTNKVDNKNGKDGTIVRRVNLDYDKVNVGGAGYIFLVLYDDNIGVVYYPQGRTTKGFSIKFVE